MREKIIENHLYKEIKKLGGECFKWCSPNNRGVPDRIVFINGQIWFIELKASLDCKRSPLQVHVGKIIKEYTNNYTVISSISEVNEFIKKVTNVHK